MTRLAVDVLEEFCRELIEALGASSEIAAKVAESLVLADLAGHHSHGVNRVPQYAGFIEDEILDPTASPSVTEQSGVAASVDGNRAYGQIVGREAIDVGMTAAIDAGIGVVGIKNGTHLGRIGEWAERAANEGYVFGAFVNTQGTSRTVAPAGSADRKLATNPVAFGIPTYEALDFPIVLDMATSQVAHGKIRERAATGEAVPEAWTVSADGSPVTDAEAFEAGEGALRPLGGEAAGYKGFGLAVIVELLAGIIGDAPVYGQDETGLFSNAAAFVVIDPLVFTDKAGVKDRVASLAAYLADADDVPGVSAGIAAKTRKDEIVLPGEPEYRSITAGREQGIEIDDGILDRLTALAHETGIQATIPAELWD